MHNFSNSTEGKTGASHGRPALSFAHNKTIRSFGEYQRISQELTAAGYTSVAPFCPSVRRGAWMCEGAIATA